MGTHRGGQEPAPLETPGERRVLKAHGLSRPKNSATQQPQSKVFVPQKPLGVSDFCPVVLLSPVTSLAPILSVAAPHCQYQNIEEVG